MSTLYPSAIDGYSQIRVVRDGIEEIVARDHNDMRSAVVAIERALGVNPQGSFGTVVARLDDAYGNLANHVLGGVPRHTDDVINASAKSNGSFNLSLGTVQSQLGELLGFVNDNSVFLGLSDTPSSYSGQGGKSVRVNSGGTALEFSHPSFLSLSDTPSVFTASNRLRVNSGGTAVEFVADTFLTLTDSPSSYSGQGGKVVQVNSGATALEFADPPAGTFLGLSDTPLAWGTAGQFVVVNSTVDGLEFSSTGAVSIDFTDINDTPATYSGAGGKIVSVKSDETGVETEVELPTEFLQRAFDSFVIEGLEVTQDGSGINAIVGTGKFASNGRIFEVTSPVSLTTSIVSGTYYVSIKFDPSTQTYDLGSSPTNAVLDAVGNSIETTVLLAKFDHDGATWTDSTDLRRYGMLVNNKDHFTVGRNTNIPDGYGVDFTSLKSAVEHIKAINTGGSTKRAPNKIVVVDDLSISSAAEANIDIDFPIEINGCGNQVDYFTDNVIFNIESDDVIIENMRFRYSGITAVNSGLAKIAQTGNVNNVRILNNTMEYISSPGSVAPGVFVQCGDGSTYTVKNSVFRGNVAYVYTSGISGAGVIGLENSVIEGNIIYQAGGVTPTNEGIVTGANCTIANNVVNGQFQWGIRVRGENTVVSGNTVNGGTGDISTPGVAEMQYGIYVQDTRHVLVADNIVKGITLKGIYSTYERVSIVGNYINNLRDPGSTSMIGIHEAGGNSLVSNNQVLGAGDHGIVIESETICSNNSVLESQSTLNSGIEISSSSTGCVVIGNKVGNSTTPVEKVGIDVRGGTLCVISNNYVHGNSSGSSYPAIDGAGTYSVVDGNLLVNANGLGIDAGGNYGCVTNNVIVSCTSDAINSVGGQDCLIANNHIYTPGRMGIYQTAGTALIASNQIYTPSDEGIKTLTAPSTLIVSNQIYTPTGHGIQLTGDSSYSVIANNHVYNGDLKGIHLESDASSSDNVHIIGNYIYGQDDEAIRIEDSAFTLIANNFMRDGGGVGIYTEGNSFYNSIIGNYIYGPGSNAVQLTGNSDYMLVSNNYICVVAGSGIYSESSAIDYSIINGNYMYNVTNYGIYLGAGGSSLNSSVANNFFYTCNNSIYLSGATYTTISGNYVYNDDAISIYLDGQYSLISGNYIYSPGGASSGAAIRYQQSDTAVIGNYLFNNTAATSTEGIRGATGVGYCLIANNYVKFANNGVTVQGVHNIISGNRLINCQAYGIQAGDEANTTIVGNYIDGTANVTVGIYIDDAGHNSSIIGNYVSDCEDGIYARSDGCLIAMNRVYDCDDVCIDATSALETLIIGNRCSANSGATTAIDIDSCNYLLFMGNHCDIPSGYAVQNSSLGSQNLLLGNVVVGGTLPINWANSPGTSRIYCYKLA